MLNVALHQQLLRRQRGIQQGRCAITAFMTNCLEGEEGKIVRGGQINGDNGKTKMMTTTMTMGSASTGLLVSLVATAATNVPGGDIMNLDSVKRGQRWGDNSDDDDNVRKTGRGGNGNAMEAMEQGRANDHYIDDNSNDRETMYDCRRRFNAIMEKGRVRSHRAFGGPALTRKNAPLLRDSDGDNINSNNYYAVLNAALAKANRLK
jgi:hypothetical protein